MSVLARPNHPLRLAGIFAGSLCAAAIMMAAVYAAVWMVREELESDVAGMGVSPRGSVLAPDGLIIVVPVADADEFEELTGFEPFVPERVPSTTDTVIKFSVTQPDGEGRRVGRVAFSSTGVPGEGGITGPVVVLAEAEGEPGRGVDGVLKKVNQPGVRALVSTIACGDLVIDVQLFFGPEPAAEEEAVTPYMIGVARGFLADVQEQCGR